jgi:hypothetical protein
MQKKSFYYYGMFFLILAIVLSGCSTKKILINVKRPAEVNLKGYEKIAVSSLTGQNKQHANDVADEIASAMFETKRFEVLDRQHIDKILSEQKLGLSGLIDEDSAPELGRIIGTAAMIFGRIQTDEYKESTSKKDWTEKKTTGKKKNKKTEKIPHTTYYRDGNYNLAVNIKLVDIETGKMLAVKTLSSIKNKSINNVDAKAPKIDDSALYRECLSDIKSQFTRLVAPFEVKVEASFETDDALPEVQLALVQFKIGEWGEGVKLLENASHKPGFEQKIKAKAIYNLGLAKMYGGDCEEAIELFKKAVTLNPDSGRYQKAVITAKKEKEKADKLKEQENI